MSQDKEIKRAILRAFHKFGEGLENERLGLYKIVEEVGLPEDELYKPISELVEEKLIEPVGFGVEWYRLTFWGEQYVTSKKDGLFLIGDVLGMLGK